MYSAIKKLALLGLASGRFVSAASDFNSVGQAFSPLHQSHLQLLDAINSHAASDKILEFASTRKAHLASLMLSDPHEALRLSDNLYEHASNNAAFEKLLLAGHVENSFFSRVDLNYACGVRHQGTKGKQHFCEETLFKKDERRSYNVHIPEHFPLAPQWTHRDVEVSGYTLGSSSVVHAPFKLASDPDYTAPTGAGVSAFGKHNLLLIMVDFSDMPGPVGTQADLDTMRDQTTYFFGNTSYSQVAISSVTFTPTLRMPQSSSAYWTDYSLLASDASAVAEAAGYDDTTFDLVVWLFPRLSYGWAGLGYVGAKGVWDNGYVDPSFGVKVMCHELGHNFGLSHASAWHVTDGNVLSPQGQNDEYGDTFDMMGYGMGVPAHYNAFYKLNLGWLSMTTNTASCGLNCPSWSGIIWPSDRPESLQQINALDLHRNSDTPAGDHYWLSTKSLWSRDKQGLFVHTSQGTYGIPKVYLLNMHPEYNTNTGVDHAALQIGETYSDCGEQIHVTNVGYSTCPGSNDPTLMCVNTVVNRNIVGASSDILGISIAQFPSSVTPGIAFSLTATTSEQAVVSWNFAGDTYSNTIGVTGTYTYPASASGTYQNIQVQATNQQGKFTRWVFPIAVGSVSGKAPVTSSLGYTFTCAGGKIAGYAGNANSGTNAPPPPSWYVGGFGGCSVTCGGGVATQSVTCRFNGNVVPDAKCNPANKPITSTPCNTGQCDSYVWATSAFTTCSLPCYNGVFGTKTRSVNCQVATTSTTALKVGAVVDSSMCSQTSYVPSPATTVECSRQSCSVSGPNNMNADGSCLHGYTGSLCNIVPSVTVLSPVAVGAPWLVTPGATTLISWNSTGSATSVQILLYAGSSTNLAPWPTYIARNAPNFNFGTNSFMWRAAAPAAGAYTIKVVLNTVDGYDASASVNQYIGEAPTMIMVDPCRTQGITCLAGGMCNMGQCQCVVPPTGDSTTCDPCADNDCNGYLGVCSRSPDYLGICVGCINGYTGNRCERAPGCTFPCSNGGYVNQDCATCTCPPNSNFTGASCQTCSLQCGAYGKPSSDCTSCTCNSGYYNTGDDPKAPCVLRYVQATIRLAGIPFTQYNTTGTFNMIITNAIADVAFTIPIDPQFIAVDKTVWVAQGDGTTGYLYLVIAFKQPPSMSNAIVLTPITPESMRSIFMAKFSSPVFTDGDVGQRSDASFGAVPGDATPNNNSTFFTQQIIIIIVAAVAGIILIVLVSYCVYRQRRRARAIGHRSYAAKEIQI